MPNIEAQSPQNCFVREGVIMEKLLTLQEVLELIRVSYSTLRRWMNAGTFPQSIGRGKLLFTQSSVENWMDQQSEPVNTPVVTTSKERRQADESWNSRQQAARATLERHRKAKVK
jgi:predicted DNA-binding transcriptional regulator AlpA